MIKILELFSGIGCQVQALKNIGIECVSTQCEIDKYAVNTYNQLHGETPNLGDISKVKVEDLKEPSKEEEKFVVDKPLVQLDLF